ncbi:MAG: DUF5808 domain-containing protein [Chloroflexota bacterium]
MKELKSAVKVVGMALVTAAIVHELKKPPAERTWRGRLNFSIPYDFSIPTPERLREAYWNPDDDRIFTDRVFGVGWAINFHALLRKTGCSCCLPKSEE